MIASLSLLISAAGIEEFSTEEMQTRGGGSDREFSGFVHRAWRALHQSYAPLCTVIGRDVQSRWDSKSITKL